jgi:hypothetical protein
MDSWGQLVGRSKTLNSRATNEQAANVEQHDDESLCRVAASHKTTEEAPSVDFDATSLEATPAVGTEVAESCASPVRGTDATPATTEQSPRAAGPRSLNWPIHKANDQAVVVDECQESSTNPRPIDPVVATEPPARPGISATCPIDLTLDNDPATELEKVRNFSPEAQAPGDAATCQIAEDLYRLTRDDNPSKGRCGFSGVPMDHRRKECQSGPARPWSSSWYIWYSRNIVVVWAT